MTKDEALDLTLEAHQAMREWIDAVPDDTVLPAMPGCDRDWIDTVEATLKQALAAPTVQEPSFKVGNLVTLTGGDYPGLGQWFVQLWDGDEVAARVYGDDREAINRRIAALTTPPAKQQPAVPKGWKLVPVEPTQEMLDAFKHRYKEGDFWRERIHGAVAAMLAAAPEQKGNV